MENQSTRAAGGALDFLNLDALSLNEEMINMRRGGSSNGLSYQDKVILHLRYLLTSRFEESHDLSLKLMKTFISTVGSSVKESSELLNAVAQLHVPKETYKTWTSCIGAFLRVVREQKFFSALPLQLLEFDLNSLTYAQDSRSYLIPVIKQFLPNGDLAFYVQYFLPMILALDQKRNYELNVNRSELKAKKYETLMV